MSINAANSLDVANSAILIVFAVADFGMSWAGVNLTEFLGPVSRFSPMIFGFIGATLLNVGKESG